MTNRNRVRDGKAGDDTAAFNAMLDVGLAGVMSSMLTLDIDVDVDVDGQGRTSTLTVMDVDGQGQCTTQTSKAKR